MVEGNDALLQGAPRELKGAHLIAKVMVEGRGVHFKVVGIVQRVCMEVPISVWHMEVASDVLCLSVQRVQGDGLTTVFDMVEVKDASILGVARVHKAAPTSARPMVEERDAVGAILGLFMVAKLLVLVAHLQGGRQVFVHSIVVWFRIRGSMEVLPWVP